MKRFLVVLVVAALAAGCGGVDEVAPTSEALLVVSMPGVGWADVERLDLPNLERFASDAAIAHLATRLGRRSARIDDAYLTIGAGTRALAPPRGGGVAVEPGESFGGAPAGALVERRVGREPEGPAYVNVAVAAERNAGSTYGATVGDLGEALAQEGVSRSVIANADTSLDAVSPESFGRDAVAALMDHDGLVDGGAVSAGLLEPEGQAPWGITLDADAVITAFESAWGGPGQRVVLVETSDLRRAATYTSLVNSERAAVMRDDALRRSDALLGRLLAAAGPDATVLVVSPVAPPGGNDLALTALRSSATGGGFLRSPTTRRSGYVQLADIAPTMRTILGHEVAEDAEGRPFTFEPDGRSLESRVDVLVSAAEQSRFRDSNLPLVVTAIVVLLFALSVVAVALWRSPSLATPARRRLVRLGAFLALGVVPATFVAHVLDAATRSTVLYALVVLTGAVLVASVAARLDRDIHGVGIVFSVGLVVATIAIDVLIGAPLQVNAIFGYSVAVAGRFAGIGNLAFALLSSAALLLAVLLVHQFGDRGRPFAIATLIAVVAIDGLPMLGADVGGVLSMVPAFGIAALLLVGRRIRSVDVIGVAGAALAVLFTAAFIDSARPQGTRTHLARLAEHLTDGRWDRLFDSLVRRWAASFGGGELGAYVLLLLVAFVTSVYVAVIAVRSRERSGAWRRFITMSTSLRAATVGLALLAILGLVANDSSVAVPATMLIIIVPVAVERSVEQLESAS